MSKIQFIIICSRLSTQAVVDPDLLIIGRDQLPENGEVVTDTFLFFDQSKGAMRFGSLQNSSYWSPDSLGYMSVSWGQANQSNELGSTAWGSRTKSTGGFSTTWGGGTKASGYYATASGLNSQASGSGATAFGRGTIANENYSLVIGTFNDSLVPVPPNLNTVEDSPLFIIGNGDPGVGNESNAMVVRKNGHLEIQGSNENNEVDVTITSKDALINLGLAQEGPHGFAFGDPDAGEGMKMLYRTVPNTLNVELGKDFGSNTNNIFELQEDGDLIIAGSLMQNSDRRLKKEITPISNAGERIDQISGYTYYWKDSYRPTRKQIGLIAQEVQEVLPDLVQEDEEGLLQLDYIALIPLLVESLKEERKERKNQQRKYEILEKKINNIEQLLKQK